MTPPLFNSFWMAGFEGADHVASQGRPLALNRATAHWSTLDDDYARLAGFGLRTVRESVGWRLFDEESGGAERLSMHAALAQRHGIQVIWTLHHYGLPAGIDFFADDFADRFADFCERAARCVLPFTDGPPLFQPINEISFLSWAVASTRLMHPHRGESPAQGYELKCRLVRAALRGCDAIWALAPGARIVHTDPMIHVVADDAGDPAQCAAAAVVAQQQFQAWDLIAGRAEPGLGGAPRYLDVLGVNYYHANQ